MSMQTKTIGRMPTDHGPYDPQLAYGKKFQCTLFGCAWESLHDNNNTAPAVWDGGDTITPNLVDWKKVSGSYEAWLMNKDKPASTGTTGAYPYNGMGRVVIPKKMVNGVNTLTHEAFEDSEGNDRENTIYVIQYDFTLGEDITVPANCVLEFDGGSISGAYTITGNNTGIQARFVKIFNTNVTLAGTWNVTESYPEWFGAKGDGVTDDTNAIQSTIASFNVLYLMKKTYLVTDTLILPRRTFLAVGIGNEMHGQYGVSGEYSIILFKPQAIKRLIYLNETRDYADVCFGTTFKNILFNLSDNNAVGIQIGKVTSDDSIPNVRDFRNWMVRSDDKSEDNTAYNLNVIFDSCTFIGGTNFALLRSKCFNSILKNSGFLGCEFANIKYGCDNILDDNNRYNHCNYSSLNIGSGTFTVGYKESRTNITCLSDNFKLGCGVFGCTVFIEDYYIENGSPYILGTYTVNIDSSTNIVTGLPSNIDYLQRLTPFKVESADMGTFFTTLYEENGNTYMDRHSSLINNETVTLTQYRTGISIIYPYTAFIQNCQFQKLLGVFCEKYSPYFSAVSIRNVNVLSGDYTPVDLIEYGGNNLVEDPASINRVYTDLNIEGKHPCLANFGMDNDAVVGSNNPITINYKDIIYPSPIGKVMYHKGDDWTHRYENTIIYTKPLLKCNIDYNSVYKVTIKYENIASTQKTINYLAVSLCNSQLQSLKPLFGTSKDVPANTITEDVGYIMFPNDLSSYYYICIDGGYTADANSFHVYGAVLEKVDSGGGTTTQRPVLDSTIQGFKYFDTTLGKPIYWNGTAWVDATGATV